MPIHNFTIDDGSATIAYEPRGNWIDSDPTYANLSDYFSGSFHASQRSGAKATFSFNGTGVYIYGTKRRDHGPYSVAVNGTTFRGDGRPAGDDESPAVLYSRSDLPYGLHTVVLTNEGSASFLDLDYIDITTGDGNSSTVVMDQTLDDADKAFTYDKHWGPGPPKLAGNETKHATNVPHAQANITFNGNAIRVCSTSGRKHGMFSVSLDGAPSVAYNASAPTNRQRTLLYSLDGLPDGNHVLTVENLSNDAQHWFALDQVIVSNYVANTSEPSMSWTGTPVGASKSSHIGAIVGAVIGGLVGLGLLFVLGWVFWRRGYRMNRRNRFFKFDIDDETGGSRMHQSEQSFHHSTPESVSGAGHLDTTPMSSVTVPLPATSLTLQSHDLPPSYNVVSPSASLRTTVVGDGKGKEVVLTYET